MKIQTLLQTKKVIASGFAAITALGAYSQGTEEVILSSLAPSMLFNQGITSYYALEIPRGAVYNSADDIIEANLTVCQYMIKPVSMSDNVDTVIVSRHNGTVDLLKQRYPNALVFAQVIADDITGKHVIGTLPPHLIMAAEAYTAVTIANFDYTKDGDLNGQELQDRLIIANQAIKVEEISL